MKWLDNIVDSILLQESDNYENILDDNSVVSTANMVNVGRNRAAIIARSKMAQFSAILDRRTCPLCKELDGMYVEVGSADHLEYTPPIHSKCRCIWVYIGDEDKMPTVNFKKPNQELIKKHGNLIGKSGAISKLLDDTQLTVGKDMKSEDLEKLANKLFKNMSEEELKYLKDYTDFNYKFINRYLRHGKKDIGVVEQTEKLSKFFDKHSTSLKEDTMVYRGVKLAALGVEDVKGLDKLIGKKFIDKGFVSTSIDKEVTKDFRGVRIDITVPKNAKVLPVDGKSVYVEENEVLLNKNSSFKITAIEESEGKHKAIIKCILEA
jgi:hypothetical protein